MRGNSRKRKPGNNEKERINVEVKENKEKGIMERTLNKGRREKDDGEDREKGTKLLFFWDIFTSDNMGPKRNRTINEPTSLNLSLQHREQNRNTEYKYIPPHPLEHCHLYHGPV
jgi:hypothetical protein